MDQPFQILHGSEDAKGILISLLHTKGEKKTGLKEFLKHLEELEKDMGQWWLALDEYQNPRGALTVRYFKDKTYLRSIWTRDLRRIDQENASKQLIQTWLEETTGEIREFRADVPVFSYLIKSIEETGFYKLKMLLSVYEIDVNWQDSELPEKYLMRPVEKEELPDIYKQVIKPDLDPASPIYVSQSGFNNFVTKLPDEAFNAFVCVENEVGKVIGFGASFLNNTANIDTKPNQAVLFGPHSTESAVLVAIISEMMNYWKLQGINSLKIFRVSEFYPSVINKLGLKMTNSTVRYIYSRD